MLNKLEKWELAKKRKGDAKATDRPQIIRAEAEARKQISAWGLDPIKQYIRREGWECVLSAFIQKIRACGITRPWKYLTLPGPSAIDIGHLYRRRLLDVTPEGRLSVAICDRNYADKVALRLEKFGGTLASSEKELQDALGDSNNVLVKEFPFDVINLDFCNALILPNRNNLYALDQIFALQRGQGFLLLFTSRPEPAQRDEHLSVLAENLQNEPQFQDAYRVRYATNDPTACLVDYTTFTQIVFSKIIARYGREFGYRVHEHFIAKYRRPNGFDMISHSFELDPLIGKKQDVAKYKPRWESPQRNRVEQILRGELPARVRQEAEGEYKRYICRLPSRQVLNVNEFLAGRQALYDELMKGAVSLETWLN